MEASLVVPFAIWHPDSPPFHRIEIVHILPGEKQIATGSSSGQVCLWDVNFAQSPTEGEKGKAGCSSAGGSQEEKQPSYSVLPRFLLCGHTSPICAMGHVPSTIGANVSLVTASLDGSLRVWDPVDGKCQGGSDRLLTLDYTSTTISSDISRSVSSLLSSRGAWKTSSPMKCVKITPCCVPHQTLVACCANNGFVFVVDVKQMVIVTVLADHEDTIATVTTVTIPIPHSSAKEEVLISIGKMGRLTSWRVVREPGHPLNLQHFTVKHLEKKANSRKTLQEVQGRSPGRFEDLMFLGEDEDSEEKIEEEEGAPVALSLTPDSIFAAIAYERFFTIYLSANMRAILSVSLSDLKSSLSQDPNTQLSDQLPFDLSGDTITDIAFTSPTTITIITSMGVGVTYTLRGLDGIQSPGLSLPYGIRLGMEGGSSEPLPSFLVDRLFSSASPVALAVPTEILFSNRESKEGKKHFPLFSPDEVSAGATSSLFVSGDSEGVVSVWSLKRSGGGKGEDSEGVVQKGKESEGQSEQETGERGGPSISLSRAGIDDGESLTSSISSVLDKIQSLPKNHNEPIQCRFPHAISCIKDNWRPPQEANKRPKNIQVTSTLLLEDTMTLILGFSTGKLSVYSLCTESAPLVLYDRLISSSSNPLAHQGTISCLWGKGSEVAKSLLCQNTPKAAKWKFQGVDSCASGSPSSGSSTPPNSVPMSSIHENILERRWGILASSGLDGLIKIWELKGGCLVHSFRVHSSPVYDLYYCPFSFYARPESKERKGVSPEVIDAVQRQSEPKLSVSINQRSSSDSQNIKTVRVTESTDGGNSSEDESQHEAVPSFPSVSIPLRPSAPHSQSPYSPPTAPRSRSRTQLSPNAPRSPPAALRSASRRSADKVERHLLGEKREREGDKFANSSPSLFTTPLSASLSPSFPSSLSAFLSGLGGEETPSGIWKKGEEGELTDGLWLLSVSRDKTVCLVSLRQLTHIATFGPHPSPIKSVGILAAQGFLFVSCSDDSLYIWSIWTGKLERYAKGIEAKVLFSTCVPLKNGGKTSAFGQGLSARTPPTSSSYDLDCRSPPPLQFVYVNAKVMLSLLQKPWATQNDQGVTSPTPSPRSRGPPPAVPKRHTKPGSCIPSLTPPANPSHRRSRSASHSIGQVKPITHKVPEIPLLQEQIFFRAISLFIPWGALPASLTSQLTNKLFLSPLPISFLPVVRGKRGAATVVLPRPDQLRGNGGCEEEKVEIEGMGVGRCWMEKMRNMLCYSTSPSLSALHLLASVVLGKQMGTALGQKEVCENFVSFLSSLLGKKVKNFMDPSMLFLSEFWRNPVELVQSSAKDLFLQCCKEVSPEKRSEYIQIWVQRLRNRGSDESKTTAALVLGTIALEYPNTFISNFSSPVTPLFSSPTVSRQSQSSLAVVPPPPPPSGMMTKTNVDLPSSEPDVRVVCRALVKLVMNNHSSLQLAALHLLGTGYQQIWRGHVGDTQAFVLRLFRLWQQEGPISAAAKTTLLQFARPSPGEVAIVMTDLLLSGDLTTSGECTSALLFLRMLMGECTFDLIPEIPVIANVVVQYLDPGNNRSMEAGLSLNELVMRYPMTSFHQGSQLLAVGTTQGTISIYDLKQAQEIHVLDPNEDEDKDDYSPQQSRQEATWVPKRKTGPSAPPGVTAVAFNSQGQIIAAYSFEEGEIRFWQLYSMSFFGFSLRPQVHCSFSVPRGRWTSLDDVVLHWTSPRSVELRYSGGVEAKAFTI